MPPTGSTFTDWQQVDRERPLLIDEDFSWSEPPRRRRREVAEPPRRRQVERQAAMLERDRQFEAMIEQWDAEAPEAHAPESYATDATEAYATEVRGTEARAREERATAEASRRTVVITGRGDARYMPAPRRRPSSGLAFHERSSFSPDRAGLWAVLLGIALLIGCIAH